MKNLLLSMILFAAGANAATELPDEARADLDRATLLAIHADWAANLRRAAVNDGDAIASDKTAFFSAVEAAEWRSFVSPELDSLQTGDFFLGAQVWMGPFDEKGAVLGFYNPWWDALLVIRTEGPEIRLTEGASPVAAPAVARFAWASGETLRSDPAAPHPASSTVIPGDDPLSVSLWRAQTGALAAFNALCDRVQEDRPDRFPFASLPDPGNASAMRTEWERIEVRSAIRLRQITLLAENRIHQAVADRCRTLLRSGSRARLRAHFTSPAHAFFIDSFTTLPAAGDADLRGNFEIYGYIPAEAGTLFVFVNAEAPRLYATVSFPAGREENADAGNVVFEWYDLDKASDFLSAWNEEHTRPQ